MNIDDLKVGDVVSTSPRGGTERTVKEIHTERGWVSCRWLGVDGVPAAAEFHVDNLRLVRTVEEERAKGMHEVQVGDTVRLKSGSPPMTVTGITDFRRVQCYYTDAQNRVLGETLPLAALVRVEPEAEEESK